MDSALKILALFGLVFLVLSLIMNFLSRRFPHIPGDIYIEKPGFSLYVPFTSSIVSTVLLSYFLSFV